MTKIQIILNRLKKKNHKCKRKALKGCPQKKGTCIRVGKTTPKKPNSANRPYARVILSTKQPINCHIPGETHNLRKFSPVLIRGGRVPDIPGINYRIIRGKLDLIGLKNRKNARSKYGTKNFNKIKI